MLSTSAALFRQTQADSLLQVRGVEGRQQGQAESEATPREVPWSACRPWDPSALLPSAPGVTLATDLKRDQQAAKESQQQGDQQEQQTFVHVVAGQRESASEKSLAVPFFACRKPVSSKTAVYFHDPWLCDTADAEGLWHSDTVRLWACNQSDVQG